jgi:hypothetical protein
MEENSRAAPFEKQISKGCATDTVPPARRLTEKVPRKVVIPANVRDEPLYP